MVAKSYRRFILAGRRHFKGRRAGILTGFADRVDGLMEWFCMVCDGPRLAYVRMVWPQAPPTLLAPVSERRGRYVPSKQKLLGLAEMLEYFHAVRGKRQSISLTELARAIKEEDEWRLPAVASLCRYPYVWEYSRRRKRGEPRQRYLKLNVWNAWETLADVIGVLGDGEDGGADVDLVVRMFYAICPDFNKKLPKGLSNLGELFAAFPGTFEVSSGKVRCVAPFGDPRPESEITGSLLSDVHTRGGSRRNCVPGGCGRHVPRDEQYLQHPGRSALRMGKAALFGRSMLGGYRELQAVPGYVSQERILPTWRGQGPQLRLARHGLQNKCNQNGHSGNSRTRRFCPL